MWALGEISEQNELKPVFVVFVLAKETNLKVYVVYLHKRSRETCRGQDARSAGWGARANLSEKLTIEKRHWEVR